MKTTIYDLLSMIKNDIFVKRVLFRNRIYEYEEDGEDYFNEEDGWLLDDYSIISILNEPVEILETTITYKQDEPTYKKIDGEWYVRKDFKPNDNIIFVEKEKQNDKIEKLEISGRFTKNQKKLASKINEIIDRLNKEN